MCPGSEKQVLQTTPLSFLLFTIFVGLKSAESIALTSSTLIINLTYKEHSEMDALSFLMQISLLVDFL